MDSLLDQATASVRRRRHRAVRKWLERHHGVRTALRVGRWAWRRSRGTPTGSTTRPPAGGGRRAPRRDNRTGVLCGHCNQQVPMHLIERHLAEHEALQTSKPRRRDRVVVPAPNRQRRTGSRPAATGTPPPPPPSRPAPPPAATARPTPAASGAASTGRTTTLATQETTALTRAANGVGEMDPRTAWDLDAQLAGMSTASLALGENVGQWIERLDAIKTDPRVTGAVADATSQLAELAMTFARTRKRFRQLYAAQFAAAEDGVRPIHRPGFWDTRNAG
jgi:hypothetical protein